MADQLSTQARTSSSAGAGMAKRFALTQSIIRLQGLPAIVTLAAIAALTPLNANARAPQDRPAPSTEATAPRDAGEPIMAIVSSRPSRSHSMMPTVGS